MGGHKAKTAWGAPKADNPRRKEKERTKSSGVEKRAVFSYLPTQSDLTTLELIRVQCYMSGYKLLSTTVGSGAYAKVYLAEVTPEKTIPGPDTSEVSLRQTNPMVAVKVINKNIIPSSFLRKFIPRELENHRGLSPHPNVVRCFEHFSSGDHVFVIMEYCEGGDLLQFINRTVRQDRALRHDLIRKVFTQICLGLEHLHAENIVHRDLKCENILLSRDHDVKITDFGFSCRVEEKEDLLRTSCGSYTYAAPEVIASKLYNGFKADVWSLGIILFAMANGRLPFTERLVTEMNDQMKQQVLVFEDHVHPDCSVLLQKILQYDPDKRPTLATILTDKWLSDKNNKSPANRMTNRPKWVNSYNVEKDDTSLTVSQLRVGNASRYGFHDSSNKIPPNGKPPIPRKAVKPVEVKADIRASHRPATVPGLSGEKRLASSPVSRQGKPLMAHYLTVTEERHKLEQSKARLSVAADPQSFRYVPKWFFQKMLQANDKLKTYYSKPKCRWVSSTKLSSSGPRVRQWKTSLSDLVQPDREPMAPRSTPEPKLEIFYEVEEKGLPKTRLGKGCTPPTWQPVRDASRKPCRGETRSPTRAKSCMARLTEPQARVPVILVTPIVRPEGRKPEVHASNSSPKWRASAPQVAKGGHLHTRSSHLRCQVAKEKSGRYKSGEAAILAVIANKAWHGDTIPAS